MITARELKEIADDVNRDKIRKYYYEMIVALQELIKAAAKDGNYSACCRYDGFYWYSDMAEGQLHQIMEDIVAEFSALGFTISLQEDDSYFKISWK